MKKSIIIVVTAILIVILFFAIYRSVNNKHFDIKNTDGEYSTISGNDIIQKPIEESDMSGENINSEDIEKEEVDYISGEGLDYILSGEKDEFEDETLSEESIETPSNETNEIQNNEPEQRPSNTSNDEPSRENNKELNNQAENKVESASTFELKKVGKLQYYLYTPSNAGNDMPLIIYLHGGTNKQADVTALLTTDGFPKYLYEGYYGDLRAYVAIPKLESNYKGWSDISDNIRDLIKTLNSEYKISMDKIALTGHSMGGTGTYQLQIKLSNTFACIAPMSGSVQNNETNLEMLGKTKIWAFVGTDDTIVKPDSSREIISALKKGRKKRQNN